MINRLVYLLVFCMTSFHLQASGPPDYQVDTVMSEKLTALISKLGLDGDFDVGEDGIEQISLAVIDLNSEIPLFAGVNAENFIYPASVYKMYVAAEVLHQVSLASYALDSVLSVDFPNIVDRTKEIQSDPRPLLKQGDSVTVNYLLDLMITRSDNSAANCLIDVAGREKLNGLLHRYGWEGSEVTRKFLSRSFEDPGYKTIRGTETSALHAAEFLYRIETNRLVNPWVSMQMKTLLGRQLDKSKLATGLPDSCMFYHKTGWFSYWTHDVGIVDDGHVKYVIACFLPVRETDTRPLFSELSSRIYRYYHDRYIKD